MKKLAIIGSGRMAWIIGINAKELGIETHSISFDENCISKETCDYHHLVNILDLESVLALCKGLNIDGVIATTELTVSVASFVAEKMQLPGIPYNIAQVITDKYHNRIACKGLKHLLQPNFVEIHNKSEIDNLRLSFPLIIKPVSKGGKRGIIVAKEKSELIEAFDFSKRFSGDAPIIIEEYLEGGKEYSVESLTCNGKHYIIQVTEKISSGAPHCVELAHHQPAPLSKSIREKVEIAVKEGLNAIKINNTSCHTEIKIINDHIYLIEFNARPGGDHIAWPLTTLSTGYSYIQGAIKISIGEFLEPDIKNLKKYYAGVYFVTKQSARLKPVFDTCDSYAWLYQKNYVSEELQDIEHNDCYGTNSIIYFSKDKRIVL